MLSSSRGATRKDDLARRGKAGPKREPGSPPESDYHYIDRLQSMFNGAGFIYDQVPQLWVVDVETGEARRLTDLASRIEQPAWSPDGTRIAFASNPAADRDLGWRGDVFVVDVATGERTRITGGRGYFYMPAWLPDGRTLAVLGHRYPAAAGSRADIWLFAADGSESGPRDGRNLSARHDLMPGSAMNSDLTIGEEPHLWVGPDGRSILFSAPVEGAYELWRIGVEDGALERLTEGHHYLSGWDAVAGRAGATRVAVIRSAPTELPDVHLLDVPARRVARPLALRQLSELNREALDGIALVEPATRWTTIDGPAGPGLARAGGRSGPAGPPAPWTDPDRARDPRWPADPVRLVAVVGVPMPGRRGHRRAGHANPRGSEGYGEAFCAANYRDWGHGPDARRPGRARRSRRGGDRRS